MIRPGRHAAGLFVGGTAFSLRRFRNLGTPTSVVERLLMIDTPGKINTVDSARRADFAARLRRALDQKGWSPNDLAVESSKHMFAGRIEVELIKQYLDQKVLPGGHKLNLLSAALGVAPKDLLPNYRASMVISQFDDGAVWLELEAKVSRKAYVAIKKIIDENVDP
jgi:hypothetical protein